MRALLVLAVALLLGAAARAAQTPAVQTPRSAASLVSAIDRVDPGKPFLIGLRLQLAPGWHTYWRNPGDAGAAPSLTLQLPPGAHAGPIAWPTPERLTEGPLTSYAYTGDVLLPVTIDPGRARGPLRIAADASWLVCATTCVPEQAHFTLTLPSASPLSAGVITAPEAALFAAAAARMPQPLPVTARIAADGTLSVSGAGLPAVRTAWFFPEQAGLIDPDRSETLTDHPGGFDLHLVPAPGFIPRQTLRGVLVLTDAQGTRRSFQVAAQPGPAVGALAPRPAIAAATALRSLPGIPMAKPPWSGAAAIVQVLLLALAGGVLLNLMPCVFPILAMKAIAIARLSGADREAVRLQAGLYSAGVLAAFLLVGGAVLALRDAGAVVGWGFQFQSPLFVTAICWLLFAAGLVMSGVVAPGVTLAGSGQGLAGREGRAGSFCAGLLAVVVATPCTTPFMAAALSAAFAGPPLLALGVFLALGAGLAAPALLLALLPGLARALPRPGPWMDILKQALAFPMYGAVVWLLWVLAEEAGPEGVLAAGSGLVAVGFAAWAYGLAGGRMGWARRAGQAAAAAGLLVAALLLRVIAATPERQAMMPPAGGAMTGEAEPFSADRLAALRAAGRPVFVDLTAAWCVTCLVNERVALSPAPVRQSFARLGVVYLRGDWTRQDPAITAFLRSNGRSGVPLYLLYPRGPGAPIVLPQLLTEAEVMHRLRGLGG